MLHDEFSSRGVQVKYLRMAAIEQENVTNNIGYLRIY